MKNNIRLKIDNNKEIECFYEDNTVFHDASFCPQIEDVFTKEDMYNVGASDEDILNHKDSYSVEIEDLINNGFSFKITPFKKRIITLTDIADVL